MQATLSRSVVLGIALMITLLAIGAVGSYRNIQAVKRNAEWVTHTHEMDRLATEILRLVTEAVVYERDHAIGHSESSARTFQSAFEQVFTRFDELQRKTEDNPTQQRRIADLKVSIEALHQKLTERIALRHPDNDATGKSRETGLASTELEQVREQVFSLRSEERRLLFDREEDVNASMRTALISSVITFGLGLILFMGTMELIRRNTRLQDEQRARINAEREQLAVTLGSIDDPVITVDRHAHVVQWSQAAERFTGLLREQVVGTDIRRSLSFVDELTALPVEIPLDAVIHTGNSIQMEAPCLLQASESNGAPVSVRVSPIFDEIRRVDGAVIVLQELSEERQAEIVKAERSRVLAIRAEIGTIISHAGQTATQLEQCVRAIGVQLAAVEVSVWLVDAETQQLRSGATYRLEGLRPSSPGISEQSIDRLRAAVDSNSIVRCSVPCEWQSVTKLQSDAGPPALALWAYPLTIEDRRLGVLAVYTRKALSDLSSSELSLAGAKLAQFIERRSIEEARQASEELFRSLANSIPQLAWMARPDGHIFWYNQRWFDYTGTTLEQMQGWGWQSVHDPQELPHVLESIRHSFATGEPWEDTFPLRRSDGEFRWHLSRMLPIRDEAGRIRLWFGTNTDVTDQRNAEQRLRRVIDSMFAFVGILTADGTLIEANQAPLVAAGLSRDDVLGRKFWDCHWWTHSEDVRVRLQEAFRRAVAGELVRYDEEIRLKESQLITIDFMLQPVYDGAELVFVIPSGVDVTARKRMEMRLADSEEFLRSVLDGLANQIAVLDEHGVILMVNRAWREFADANGLNDDRYAVGVNYLETCADGIHNQPSDATAAASGIRSVLDGEQNWFEIVYPCHSPTEQRWFQMRVDRLKRDELIRVVVSHENITARMQSEAATRRWSTLQQRLAEIAMELSEADGLSKALKIVTDGACSLIKVAAAETVWRGESPREGEGQQELKSAMGDLSCMERLGIDRQHLLSTTRPTRFDSNPRVDQETSCIPEKSSIANTLVVPLTNQEGKNIGLIILVKEDDDPFTVVDEAILVQLSQMASVAIERTRLYQEVVEADERKDQFLATLAHELRNPLSAISAATQLLQLNPDDAAQVRSTAEIALKQCDHLKQLVDDLLDVSRISRGKLNLQFNTVSLQEVLKHAVETARSAIENGRHTLSTKILSENLFVRGDNVRLAQVVSNLLVNAAKYTPTGGHIDLELSRVDNSARISVRDNGIGIPEEMIERIFDLFAQVDGSHARSQGGLGIGLTLAQTLVAMHDGEILVQSDGENRGSTFTVLLPLTSDVPLPDLSSNATGDERRPRTPRRIVIVDDNRAALHLLGRLLETLGHQVHTASDGRSGLEIIAQYQPEIVISDIGMPDMSGYELAREILQRAGGTPPVLVALTGYGQDADRKAAHDAGFRHHLTKPVSMSALQELLENLA